MKVETVKKPYGLNLQQIAVPLLDQYQLKEYRRRFLWHGFFLFFLGCIIPLFIPWYSNPRAGLAAHTIGLTLGMFLICVGLALPYIRFSRLLAKATFWLLIISSYVGLGAQVLGAVIGLTKTLLITANGFPEGPFWIEISVEIAVKIITSFVFFACIIILFSLRRVKVDSSSASSEKSSQ